MRLESAPVVLIFSVARAGDVSGSAFGVRRDSFFRAASNRPRAPSASPTSEAGMEEHRRAYSPERSSAGLVSSFRYRLPEITGGARRQRKGVEVAYRFLSERHLASPPEYMEKRIFREFPAFSGEPPFHFISGLLYCVLVLGGTESRHLPGSPSNLPGTSFRRRGSFGMVPAASRIFGGKGHFVYTVISGVTAPRESCRKLSRSKKSLSAIPVLLIIPSSNISTIYIYTGESVSVTDGVCARRTSASAAGGSPAGGLQRV